MKGLEINYDVIMVWLIKKFYICFTALSILGVNAYAGVNAGKHPLSKKEGEEFARQMTYNDLKFQENLGQIHDQTGKPVPYVLFKIQSRGIDMYLTEKGLTYVFTKKEEKKTEEKTNSIYLPEDIETEAREYLELQTAPSKTTEPVKTEYCRMDIVLDGADIQMKNIIKQDASADFEQYFIGGICPDGISNIRSYQKIIVRNIYPNIRVYTD